MSQVTVGFERKRRELRVPATSSVVDYRADAGAAPRNRWVEIEGPGGGIRFLRCGSPSFESFSELAKTVTPNGGAGMSDLEKAMAVYRFSARNFHTFSMGWGCTEMTRFINCFGYSYCWGQADFQHLLYEACGLTVRAPALKGHSSVEVLLDGRWRLMDAFMRMAVPAPELDGLATGRQMFERPERWAAVCSPASAGLGRAYWGSHGSAGTYEPWQNSRAMVLNLRRGERMRMDYAPRGIACMAAYEPDDYLNGRWTWKAVLDEQHLKTEAEQSSNLAAGPAGLKPVDASTPAEVEYRVASPYPLVTGSMSLGFAAGAKAEVTISNDGRKTWHALAPSGGGAGEFTLDQFLSSRKLPPTIDVVISEHQPRYEVVVRIRWTGAAALERVGFDFVIQSHRPSVPSVERGVNQWRLVGCETGGSITHAWDEYPGLRISNDRPYEGDSVTLEADVYNRGTQAATDVPVRFIDTATGVVLGEVKVARIEPGGRAAARLEWRAAIHYIKRHDYADLLKPYLRTALRVEAGAPGAPAHEGDGLSAAAEGTLVVRPRPRPIFNDQLLWSSNGSESDREMVVLRAGVVHQQGTDETPIVYLIDAELDVTLTPYLGHPDRGGLELAKPRRLRGIQPSEYGAAEWEIPVFGLPNEFEVWVEARCAQPVAAGGERMLAKVNVKLS